MKHLALAILWLLALPAAVADEGEQVRRGRALYQGHAPLALAAAATDLRLPAEMAACARCHGATGEGGREAGQTVPPLRWSALTQPREGLAAFPGAAAVLRAVTQGRGRGAEMLAPGMPRYALQPGEAEALLAYLQRLGTAQDMPPGVSADAIRLGTVVPLSGSAAAMGAAIVAGLRAGFEEVNARGGVHGRRIDLQVQDGRGGVRQALAAWRADPVYALTGGLWNEALESADELLAQAHLPHVATLVVRDKAPVAAGWSADLLAPVALQRAALEKALRGCVHGARMAVAHGEIAAARAGEVVRWLAPQSTLVHDALRQAQPGCIAYTLASAPVVQAALPAGWTQTLVLPMPAAVLQPVVGRERAAAPWYRLGLTAARLTTELLSRAGRVLHERALLDQLDSMQELELAPGMVVHYGRQRRHGWLPLPVPLGVSADAPAPADVAAVSRQGG